MTTASLNLTKTLELVLQSPSCGQSVRVRFTRVGAQRLADALIEYSGASRKGYLLGPSVKFSVPDLTSSVSQEHEQVYAGEAR